LCLSTGILMLSKPRRIWNDEDEENNLDESVVMIRLDGIWV
jgi:hypothetical protein